MSEHKDKNVVQETGEPKTPLSLQIISVFCAMLLVVIGVVIIFVPYTRSERVQGRVDAEEGVVKIYAQLNSVVVRQHVMEGDVVRKGQPLLTLSTERQLGSGGGAELAQVKASNFKGTTLREEMANIHSLYESEQALLVNQITRKRGELSQIQTNVGIQERVLNLAKESYKRRSALVEQGFLSKEGLADEERRLLQAEADHENAKKELIFTQSAVDELEANKAMLVRRREKELLPLTRALSSTNQEAIDYQARQEFVIQAKTDGIVAAILPKLGDTVLEKDLLMSVSPSNSKFYVNLYVPSSAIGFLQKKNAVKLRYESYPYQKFGEYNATVRAISPVALDRSELRLASLATDNYYRVQVEPESQTVHAYGRDFALHDGIKVEADIQVETRKVFEWILEPVYAKFYGK
ncbi:HlyD family efflux transporter periplasmic adaptor subunit [Uliginosibacterium sp. H3]|uniref:HlyD family efflux transporter periplasmic adaptor subunit n=1 Tax=Uliginosibacterium silvisoli TaxID=3114758 RepID=A0ABU6K9V5_9RHOO|nr:HlyD family efflux transporter periplasmic adaptor subunit [Uliginosibacterium sp. H3]